MKAVKGGVTAASGFLACGIHCGIKYKNKDLALVYSQVPATAAAVFTQNKIQAAPVKVTKAHLKSQQAQAIVVNSGNANCCTGRAGLADARGMCQAVAQELGIAPEQVLVASTGVIGRKLAIEKIKQNIPALISKLSKNNAGDAASAIMTTDSWPKQIAVQIRIGEKVVTLGGMAKGAGMIHPNMATMLAFLTTDAAIQPKRLQAALSQAVNNSFNLITVEGDTSTNDMVVFLANGLAANKSMSRSELALFQKALDFICLELAKMIIQDAEGATKFVEIQVAGARDIAQAKRVAFKVANSCLVKTALFGQNPNWGRIAASCGCADKRVNEEKLSIYLGKIVVFQNSTPLEVDQQKLNNIFRRKEIQIRIHLGQGQAATRVFTCDLSDEYIKINAEY